MRFYCIFPISGVDFLVIFILNRIYFKENIMKSQPILKCLFGKSIFGKKLPARKMLKKNRLFTE